MVTASTRFWSKVERLGPDECWPWLASGNQYGYGGFYLDGKMRGAHRVSYEWSVGPIPSGLVLDHLCRNRRCVNPAHLEPVTIGENVMRGETLAVQNAVKTHCSNGHEYSPENTKRKAGGRDCRTCDQARKRKSYAVRKAA